MKGELTIQNYKAYTKEDQNTWKTLYERQVDNLKKDDKVVSAFWDGIAKLKIKKGEIPNFEKLNKLLKPITNFEIVAVTGLLEDHIFFQLIRNRKFPVTTWIRKPSQLDYIEEPDMFHDLFGHVPFLVNKTYTDFLVNLAERATPIFLSDNKEAQYRCSRLYWYTVEFGLLQKEDQTYQIYGSGIISSYGETNRAIGESNKKPFNSELLSTRFEKDHFQDFYAVIGGSFERSLLNTLNELNFDNQ